MTISKAILFAGALAIVAAATRVHAMETSVVSSWDAEERLIAAQEAKADAAALQAASQLKKEADSTSLDATFLRNALLFITMSAGVAGFAALAWRAMANRHRHQGKAQWRQHLALIGQRLENPIASCNDVHDNVAVPTIRFDPAHSPRTVRRARRIAAVTPIQPVGQLRRAA
jgi:hypothetical protein